MLVEPKMKKPFTSRSGSGTVPLSPATFRSFTTLNEAAKARTSPGKRQDYY